MRKSAVGTASICVAMTSPSGTNAHLLTPAPRPPVFRSHPAASATRSHVHACAPRARTGRSAPNLAWRPDS
ncbi:MAG: hypothetical protein ACREPY_16505 [Rhodanobacteraceae bacterium]